MTYSRFLPFSQNAREERLESAGKNRLGILRGAEARGLSDRPVFGAAPRPPIRKLLVDQLAKWEGIIGFEEVKNRLDGHRTCVDAAQEIRAQYLQISQGVGL